MRIDSETDNRVGHHQISVSSESESSCVEPICMTNISALQSRPPNIHVMWHQINRFMYIWMYEVSYHTCRCVESIHHCAVDLFLVTENHRDFAICVTDFALGHVLILYTMNAHIYPSQTRFMLFWAAHIFAWFFKRRAHPNKCVLHIWRGAAIWRNPVLYRGSPTPICQRPDLRDCHFAMYIWAEHTENAHRIPYQMATPTYIFMLVATSQHRNTWRASHHPYYTSMYARNQFKRTSDNTRWIYHLYR